MIILNHDGKTSGHEVICELKLGTCPPISSHNTTKKPAHHLPAGAINWRAHPEVSPSYRTTHLHLAFWSLPCCHMYVRTQWHHNERLVTERSPTHDGFTRPVVAGTTALSTGYDVFRTSIKNLWEHSVWIEAFSPCTNLESLKKKNLRRSSKGYGGSIANLRTLNYSLSSMSAWPQHDSYVLFAYLKQCAKKNTRLAGEITVQLYAQQNV
jgi:hypothetical protein